MAINLHGNTFIKSPIYKVTHLKVTHLYCQLSICTYIYMAIHRYGQPSIWSSIYIVTHLYGHPSIRSPIDMVSYL